MNTKAQTKTNLEKLLIMYCAPTLARIKIANLFSYQFENESVAKSE